MSTLAILYLDNLQEQHTQEKQQLTSEISVERTSHQKMVAEYARLEQRYQNLMEEKMMEKNTPDRLRPSGGYNITSKWIRSQG